MKTMARDFYGRPIDDCGQSTCLKTEPVAATLAAVTRERDEDATIMGVIVWSARRARRFAAAKRAAGGK